MDMKKGTVVLVAVALVLMVTAVALNLSSSEDVPTTSSDVQIDSGAGEVGIVILPNEDVEDKIVEGEAE